MRATIKDVARECGVSVSAVSMALSDKPSRISK
ncbi:MAG: LacI family DNA-binding transcriptional regulator [Lachnospiraceae bacterium]|nr:LacI family DNA-binding transcriptional regulator [Lachnospiraceae bacterium]